MVGRIFGVLGVVAFVYACFTGRTAALSVAVTEGAASAVTLTVSLVGMMMLWNGIMEVLRGARVIERFARCLKPLLRFLFPNACRNGCDAELSAALAANLLGIGNAATPLALRAMKRLDDINPTPGVASDDMATFTVLGCAYFSLLPSTVIAMRQAAGAAEPFAILPPVWICSSLGMLLGVIFCRLLRGVASSSHSAARARSVRRKSTLL